MKQNTASQRIADLLREKIRRGELRPGARLPSARQIVSEHGVALATATRVLALLQRERLVRAIPGIGTVVRARDDGPELSRERIVHTAIAIADDEGLAELSMRMVASELGVATMSLYRHVPSKEELVLGMIDAVMTDSLALTRRRIGEARGSWRAQLEQLARSQWAAYTRHPWIASALSMTRPQLVPSGMQHTEWVLAALAQSGLPPAATLRTGVAFIGYIRGLAMSVEPERDAEKDSGLTSQEWMESQEAQFAAVMPRFPTLARLSSLSAVDMSLDALFECGLRCFLDGIAAHARSGGGME